MTQKVTGIDSLGVQWPAEVRIGSNVVEGVTFRDGSVAVAGKISSSYGSAVPG